MKNRCRLRTVTGIALFSFYPTNMRHHSMCNRTTFLRATGWTMGTTFSWSIYYIMMAGDTWWRLIVRDIAVSSPQYRNHFSRCRATCVAVNDNIKRLTGILLLFLLTRVCFIVSMTFNASPFTSIDHPSTLYYTILLQPITIHYRKYLSDLSSYSIMVRVNRYNRKCYRNIWRYCSSFAISAQRHDSLFLKPPSFVFDGQDDRAVCGHWNFFFFRGCNSLYKWRLFQANSRVTSTT